jgi:hypothetical protein
MSPSLLGENRRLVTDELVEFEKLQVEVGDFRRITVVSFCYHLINPKHQGTDSQGRLN